MTRELEGAISLPAEVLVAPGALGKTFGGRAGPTSFSISFPSLPENAQTDGFLLEPPYASPYWERLYSLGRSWGHMGFEKHPDHPRPLAGRVGMVALNIEAAGLTEVPLYEFADQFGALFSDWYATAVGWFELWGGQVLTQLHRTAVVGKKTTGRVRSATRSYGALRS